MVPFLYFEKLADHTAPGLQLHLQTHFLAHYRLFKVLNNRDGPPTSEELALARRSAQMTPEMAVQYLEKLDAISNNVKEIFEKQAAAANVHMPTLSVVYCH
jgi:hypothetical protein